MKPLSLPRRLHLAYCSKPKADRSVYRLVMKAKPRKIVELGIGTGLRSTRLLTLANSYAEKEDICYAGIDLFEARSPDAPGTTLKGAHRVLSSLAGKVRLMPGEPYHGLVQLANVLGPVDLILISADQAPDSLTQAWFYVPRMLHDDTKVLVEQAGDKEGISKFVELPHSEIERLATAATPKRRAA